MSTSSEPAVTPTPNYSESSEFVLWSKYEDVAMHFNDLIIKLRTQALAGLAGVITVSGLAVNFVGKPTSHTEWEVLFATVLFLTLAWIALLLLDLFYYDKLLQGAVNALYQHEKDTQQRRSTDRRTDSPKHVDRSISTKPPTDCQVVLRIGPRGAAVGRCVHRLEMVVKSGKRRTDTGST